MWKQGLTGLDYRPDRVRVVLEWQTDTPIGVGRGVLLIWEVSEGALDRTYTQFVTKAALRASQPVMHIYLDGRRILYMTELMLALAKVEQDTIASLGIRIVDPLMPDYQLSA